MEENNSTSNPTDGASSADATPNHTTNLQVFVDALMESISIRIYQNRPITDGGRNPKKSRLENLTQAIENITPIALDIVIQSIAEEQGAAFNPDAELIEWLRVYIASWLRNKMSRQ